MAKTSDMGLDERVKNRFARNKKNKVREEKPESKIEGSKVDSEEGFFVTVDQVKPSVQTRLTFTEAQIAKRKRSLLAFGQLASLVLIKDENGDLHIEDGELTWRSAKVILEEDPGHKLNRLKARLSDSKNPEEARTRSLLHHQTYESLNPLDRAEGVLLELQQRTNYSEIDIVKSLRNIGYKLRKDETLARSVELYLEYNKEEMILAESLDELQLLLLKIIDLFQVDLSTYINSDLAYIYLEPELKKAVRERNLSPSHALIIHRISPKNIDLSEAELIELREQIIVQTLEERLTKRELTMIIQKLLAEKGKSKKVHTNDLKQEAKESYKIIKSELNSFDTQYLTKRELGSLKTALEKQLQKINSAL